MTIARSQTLRIALLLFILETLSLCCVGLAFGPNVGPTGLANGFSNVNLNQPFQRVGGASNLQTARLTPSFPETTPLQRVLLHSKGTIQTFFSSYYNATTNICIDSEAWVESEGGVNREFPFVVNRRVTQSIVVGDGGERAGKLVPYCIATSTIKVGDVDVYKNKVRRSGLGGRLAKIIKR
ncbi:hypothetical protein TL16_g08374 [Triparma laevis f. inornata]|uniref:Uncharacterized protein n=2 Tax=Triparma laevis TaxID=1534972 RepID=A0A9W7FF44_9STRA|nr:hypothetical protein TL16_g08374 [Triparma laevis f. inornata]GMI10961.1 hypothetical protein TrLO_g9300 [Triparma laevis f. longispina]